MPITPETLARHELIGLDVRVVAASNPDLLAVAGEVVLETTNTLHVESADRAWQVPKADVTLSFDLDGREARGASEHASGESRERVRVDGERLVARPARRTEHTGDSTWR